MKDRILHILLQVTCIAGLTGSGFTGAMAQTTTFVWPGDANENGTVSHVDLVYLGIHFGDTGPGRDSISINWTGHEVIKWLPPQAGRPDPAHSDCNGDSTIDALDLVAIETNYGLDNGFILPEPSSLANSSPTAAPLTWANNPDPLLAGQRDTLYFNLGDAANPIDSLLGFAATLEFDSNLVDSAYVLFDDSWLGTPGTDLLHIDRFQPGRLEFAATRTDQTDVASRQRDVGSVVVVMTDNLKRSIAVDSLSLRFTQALALNSLIEVVELRTDPTEVPVFIPEAEFEISVYPVPATDELRIGVIGTPPEAVRARLINGQGQITRAFTLEDGWQTMPRNGLQAGLYWLTFESGDTALHRKVIFIE